MNSTLIQKSNPLRWKIFWLLTGVLTFALFSHRAWFISESDFVAYYNAGKRALQGEALYVLEQTPFKYLPFSAYFFIPFSLISFQLSKYIFFLLSYLAGIFLYKKIIETHGNWVAFIVFCSTIRFHNYDFLNSQVNHLLLWCLMQYFWNRSTRPLLSSVCLALFFSFKVTPLIMLLPLFLMKKSKEFGQILLFFSIFCLIPVFHFKEGYLIYLHWYEFMKLTTPISFSNWEILQSIPAGIEYWLHGWMNPGLLSMTLLSIPLGLITWGSICSISYRKKYPFSLLLLENSILSAFVILSVTLSPLAWKHNYLLIWPGVLYLAVFSKNQMLILLFLCMTAFPAIISIFSPQYSDRSYLTVIGACVLFVSLTLLPYQKLKLKVQVWLYQKTALSEFLFLCLLTQPQRGDFWQPITGSVEKNESPLEAASRETVEETGITILPTQILPVDSDFIYKKNGSLFYESIFSALIQNTPLTAIHLDPVEHTQFTWLPYFKASQLIQFESNKKALKKIFSSLQIH